MLIKRINRRLKMKQIFSFFLLLGLLPACRSQPAFVDNGNPGQIKVFVYYDDNQNSAMDTDETGARPSLAFPRIFPALPLARKKSLRS